VGLFEGVGYTAFLRTTMERKLQTIVGLLLVVVGIAMLAYQGITYTTRETIIDIGPIEATAARQRTIPLPPILGGAAVLGGVAMLLVGRRR
jgi:hypothetical protein